MVSIENLDLNLVMVLHHTLSELSVARAAERLHVTPSAVSNSLAKLREILGDPLLVRHGRKLVPTPRGAALAPRVASLVEEARGIFEAEPVFDAATCTRRFTLASADNLGILAEVAERFSQQLPRATLRVVTLDHALSTDALASGDVDVLLGLPPELPRDHHAEPAYAERLVCAVWRDNKSVGRKLTLDRFLALRHVEVALLGTHAIDYIDTALARIGKRRSVAISVPHFATAAVCLEGTPHVAMLPERMAARLARSLPLKIFEAPLSLPTITILQVWHARSERDPASVMFRTLIRDSGAARRSRDRPGSMSKTNRPGALG